MNVALVAPAGTVTVAGTVPAATVSDASVITRPPTGAGLEIVTVPTDGVAPTTDVGFIVSAVRTGAVTVRAALPVDPYADAPMFAVASLLTATVVTVKVAELLPTGIVTDAGTVTFALSEVRLTV